MHYDVAIVGGGLAGASLARTLAVAGKSVMVLERETRFRDRVRGETVHPWGVAEWRKLSLEGPLVERTGHRVHRWEEHFEGDLTATTLGSNWTLDYHHPEMQESMLTLAEEGGADVRRGAAVTDVVAGSQLRVTYRRGSETGVVRARLVVGADGRKSQMRKWGGLATSSAQPRLRITGVIAHAFGATQDAVHAFYSASSTMALAFPLDRGRFRLYYVTGNQCEPSCSGMDTLPAFRDLCVAAGMLREWFTGATFTGPLATFEGAPAWVDQPGRPGMVLIGDAAGHPDPSFGHGQSVALRDVRILSERLLNSNDWDSATEAYTSARAAYFQTVLTLEAWEGTVRFGTGPAADRAREFAARAEASGTAPDFIGLGPDQPTDDATRKRFLGY